MNRITVFIALIAMTLLLYHGEAQAYIDPGTGSYFLQLLLAGLLAAAFGIKMFWRNIKAFFSSRFSRKNSAGGDDG